VSATSDWFSSEYCTSKNALLSKALKNALRVCDLPGVKADYSFGFLTSSPYALSATLVPSLLSIASTAVPILFSVPAVSLVALYNLIPLLRSGLTQFWSKCGHIVYPWFVVEQKKKGMKEPRGQI
jgi:hypothetical protein